MGKLWEIHGSCGGTALHGFSGSRCGVSDWNALKQSVASSFMFRICALCNQTSRWSIYSQEGLQSAYHHQRLRLLFFAQRKAACKKAWKQDLTDHRALREQLHTIRTASLEERHGSESDWKGEENVTQIENLRTILHKLTDLLMSKSLTKPVSSNPNIQRSSNIWCCFLELGSNYSFSNQTVQSWCEQTSVQTTLIYFLRILRGTLSFIQTHRIFTFVKKQSQTRKQSTSNIIQ